MTATDLQRRIQLEATKLGARVFRNNVGRVQDSRSGQWINFGLCTGSSDLIGWTPRLVNGQRVAVFTAVEVKWGRDVLTDEQRAFLEAVRRAGGIGIEARSVEDVLTAISVL